jgi:hypothetical protein
VTLVVFLNPPLPVPWGNLTKFIATLADTSFNGVPISGKTIHFDGTGVIPASDKTTDSSGKAIATGTAPNKVSPLWTYQALLATLSCTIPKSTPISVVKCFYP